MWCRRRVDRGEAVESAGAVAAHARVLATMADALEETAAGEDLLAFASVLDWKHSYASDAATTPAERRLPQAGRSTAGASAAEVQEDHRSDPGRLPESAAAEAVLDLVSTGPAGIDARATLMHARRDLAEGSIRGYRRMQAAMALRSSAGAWPTFVHPRLRGGCGGSGDDPLVAQQFVEAMRDLTVIERPDVGELVLLPVLDDSWRLQNIDVRCIVTFAGVLSFSLRWHGDNAALLWELTGPGEQAAITVPSIDGNWRSSERAGEALLRSQPPT